MEEMKEELNQLVTTHGLRVPVRSFMFDQEYKWRYGAPPDYTLANLMYMRGKTMNHLEGSLEQIVEDIVKTWEFERSHKVDVTDHKTCADGFRIGANGWKMFDCNEAQEVGNYNVLSYGCSPEVYTPGMTWEQSHHAFKEAFTAFPWEVLKVFSGPPKVSFSWCHWAHFTGSYMGNKGKGERVEMTGFGVAEVTPDLKLLTVEIFYNPDGFLGVLAGKQHPFIAKKHHLSFGPYVPYIERANMLAQSAQPIAAA